VEHATEEIASYLRATAVDYREDRFHNHRYTYSIDPGDPPLARAFLRASDDQIAQVVPTPTTKI
jgi:hypothetical protein